MSLSAIVISLATAWLALGVAVPALVYAQQFVLTPTNQHPIVCTDPQRKLQSDPISVESDALFKPPYNSNIHAYELGSLYARVTTRKAAATASLGHALASSAGMVIANI